MRRAHFTLPAEIATAIPGAIEAAEEAFWAVIAERLEMAERGIPGDVDPMWVAQREEDNVAAVWNLIGGNLPMDDDEDA